MKVAIYCRVSRQEQTIEQQKEPLTKLCDSNNWQYEVFEEKISGAKISRTQLDLMLQRIRNKEFNAVMVFKLDRLGRSVSHLLQLIQEFNNLNIQFICLNPNVDTKTAQGRFFITIMGAVAELEREFTIERTKDKLNYYKEQIKEKGYCITKQGRKTSLGRPTGKKDTKPRRKSGYYNRWLKQTTPINN